MFLIQKLKAKTIKHQLAFLVGVLSIGLIVSCTSDTSGNQTAESNPPSETLTRTEKITRKIETLLKISANEVYDIQIFHDYIDKDTIKDAVILVNRHAFALEKYERENKIKFLAYMGHAAPYNYVFVQLGNSDEIITTVPIGSNIDAPLNIHFDYITTPTQKDFWVEYRIKNSLYRNYYTIKNGKIFLTFNCPVFDLIGEPNPKAYFIEHKESTVRPAKDIFMYHGEIAHYTAAEIDDPNNFTPKEIISKNELFVFFIFDEKKMKYVTPFKRESKLEN